ncbi:MAG: efflux RND transporter permease subunit [Acidobacteriota bacterium]
MSAGKPSAEGSSPPSREAGGERTRILPRFSLDRRIAVLVLLATILVVGSIATLQLPLELLPRGLEDPNLAVQATWRNAPAQEMLDQIALPLEEELSTVAGVQNMFTYATTGLTRVRLSFKGTADFGLAYREVRDRLERARARMPEDVERLEIRRATDGEFPVFALGIAIDPDLTNSYDLIQNEIVMPISRLDGVAAVDVQGLVEKEVLIELDRELTEGAGLNIFELGQSLASDNFTLASGHVESGGQKLLLRSVAKYPDLEALRQRTMSENVRLGDIATVRYGVPDAFFRARANSRPANFAVVFKESEANALDVSDRVAAAVEKMQANPRLQQVELQVFFNQGQTILESLFVLLDSGRIGAVFAALILFLFLRRLRMTVIIALSIPLSLFIGLTAMYFFGETLNLISLLALMISVGLLVDNSVVVAENIFRLHQSGVPRREACIRGASEISLAIVMATLTTVIVFLPVSLVEGQGQFLLLRLSIPITVSLLASLLVALIFVPLSVYLTLLKRGAAAEEEPQRQPLGERVRALLQWLYEQSFGRLNRGYNRLLASSLSHRGELAMAILIVLGITAAWPLQRIEIGVAREQERAGFDMDISLPQSNSFEETEAHFGRIEKILEEKQDEWDLRTYVFFHDRSRGKVQGWFNAPRTNQLTARELTKELVELMPERAGARVSLGQRSSDEGERKSLHTLRLVGDDPRQLGELVKDLEPAFLGVEGVLGMRRSARQEADALAVRLDRERTQRLGINPLAVAGVVRNSIGGRSLPKFYRDGREIPVRVRFQEEDRQSLAQLQDFRVPSPGGPVALSSVTFTERLQSSNRISRVNKQVSRSLTLELEEGRESATRKRLNALAARLDLPEGVRFGSPRRGGGAQDEAKEVAFAALLSVIFIYLLMGFLFESFILPLSIVSTIPLAALGGIWGHFITGIELDTLGFVGGVLLIGVVVNNGIVLVDYINRLRLEGRPRSEAVLVAADRRFRPIMMTALTTICGMVPLVLGGQTTMVLSYESFGITLIGGMTVATLLTLLVVPVAYTLVDDLRLRLEGIVRKVFWPERSPEGAEEDPAVAEG